MTRLVPATVARQAHTAPARLLPTSQRSLRVRSCPATSVQRCLAGSRLACKLPARSGRDAARDPRGPRPVQACCAARDPSVLYVPSPPKRPNGRFSATWRRLQRTFPVLKYEELLKRIAGTMLLVGMVRFGYHTPLPGVPPMHGRFTPGGMEAQLYGSSILAADLFQLNVTPIVNASLLFAGATAAWPPLKRKVERLHQDRGREGGAIVKRWMRAMSLGIAVVMGVHRANQMRKGYNLPDLPIFGTMLTLAAGTALQLGIADGIELHGLGDGLNFLICLSIVAGYIQVLARAVGTLLAGAVSPVTLAGVGAAYAALVLASVYITELELRLPLVHYKTPYVQPKSDGQLPAALMAAEHLSLRVNPNGMMPMILASVVVHILPVGVGPFLGPVAGAALAAFQNSPIAYCVAVFFADFASLTAQTPKRLAQYLQTLETGIKGVTPGLDTEQYLAGRERELRTLGGLSMAALAAATQLFDAWCTRTLGVAIGTLNLLLLVGLITSAVRQVTALIQEPLLEGTLDVERRLLAPQFSS